MSGEKYDIHYNKPKTDYKSYENSSFVASDSPVILDVRGDLGRLTYNGEIDCDGAGDIIVSLSSDGVIYGDSMTVEAGEMLDIITHEVYKIKIDHSGTDSAYRARCW